MAELDATAPLIGFVVNGAAIGTLRVLLERDEVKNPKEELSTQITSKLSEFDYVKRLQRKLTCQLSSWILLLHIFNLALFVVVVVFLFVGPQRLSTYFPRLPALPLTSTAKILLWFWFVISGVTYLALCAAPTVRALLLVCKARAWLRDNKPKTRGNR